MTTTREAVTVHRDQALGRADAYGRALRLLEDVNTWRELHDVVSELKQLKADATHTIDLLYVESIEDLA